MQPEWQTVQTQIRLPCVCTVCPGISVQKLRIITVNPVVPTLIYSQCLQTFGSIHNYNKITIKQQNLRVWDLLPCSTTYREVTCFNVMKRQITSWFSLQNAPDKHWAPKRCFAQTLFPKLCIRVMFLTQNDGYYMAWDHPRNTQLRFPL